MRCVTPAAKAIDSGSPKVRAFDAQSGLWTLFQRRRRHGICGPPKAALLPGLGKMLWLIPGRDPTVNRMM
jgi:hypothetical protein